MHPGLLAFFYDRISVQPQMKGCFELNRCAYHKNDMRKQAIGICFLLSNLSFDFVRLKLFVIT